MASFGGLWTFSDQNWQWSHRQWTIGVGASLSFLTGHMTRAPLLLQKLGLEWAHRLAHEPTRLARRYLVDDLPFGILLGLEALGKRFSRRP